MILLDANILLRITDSKDPKYTLTLQAIFKSRNNDTLAIWPQ